MIITGMGIRDHILAKININITKTNAKILERRPHCCKKPNCAHNATNGLIDIC